MHVAGIRPCQQWEARRKLSHPWPLQLSRCLRLLGRRRWLPSSPPWPGVTPRPPTRSPAPSPRHVGGAALPGSWGTGHVCALPGAFAHPRSLTAAWHVCPHAGSPDVAAHTLTCSPPAPPAQAQCAERGSADRRRSSSGTSTDSDSDSEFESDAESVDEEDGVRAEAVHKLKVGRTRPRVMRACGGFAWQHQAAHARASRHWH
jgi:hypothetical protein